VKKPQPAVVNQRPQVPAVNQNKRPDQPKVPAASQATVAKPTAPAKTQKQTSVESPPPPPLPTSRPPESDEEEEESEEEESDDESAPPPQPVSRVPANHVVKTTTSTVHVQSTKQNSTHTTTAVNVKKIVQSTHGNVRTQQQPVASKAQAEELESSDEEESEEDEEEEDVNRNAYGKPRQMVSGMQKMSIGKPTPASNARRHMISAETDI
jgi:hypothetical protein